MLKRILSAIFMAFVVLIGNHAMDASQAEAQDVWAAKSSITGDDLYVVTDSINRVNSQDFYVCVKVVCDGELSSNNTYRFIRLREGWCANIPSRGNEMVRVSSNLDNAHDIFNVCKKYIDIAFANF